MIRQTPVQVFSLLLSLFLFQVCAVEAQDYGGYYSSDSDYTTQDSDEESTDNAFGDGVGQEALIPNEIDPREETYLKIFCDPITEDCLKCLAVCRGLHPGKGIRPSVRRVLCMKDCTLGDNE